MTARPNTLAGMDLFLKGQLALSRMEHNGIRIDEGYLDAAILDCESRIARLEKTLRADKTYAEWRKLYGTKANLGSTEQMARLFFRHLGYESKKKTGTGKEKADEAAFKDIDLPFVKDYFAWKKLQKVYGTYLVGIKRESVGGFLRPAYNLAGGGKEDEKGGAKSLRGCIAKGTLIEVVRDVSRIPEGIPIEKVRAGDYVYCYDDQLRIVIRKVLWAGKTGTRKIVRVHWTARHRRGYVDMTPEHLVRLSNGRYVQARHLLSRGRTKSWSRSYGVSVLSMGRTGDRLYVTGRKGEVWDHRVVYEQLVGALDVRLVVHHKDGNHLNNMPSNLEAMTQSQHATLHAPAVLTDAVRRKATKKRSENHALYGDRYVSGEAHCRWLKMTRYQLLRMLAQAGGRATKTPHCFTTVKDKAKQLGVNLQAVKDRYDARGCYISAGRLRRLHAGGVKDVAAGLGINFYKVKKLLEARGLSTKRRWANQCGPFVPHNHRVDRVEELDVEADVYDLEVDEFHNFIAGEVCVHNSCQLINFQNLPVRNPDMAKVIRRIFLPRREDRRLVEVDFGGIEVRVACCYTQDPRLIDEFTTPGKDPHRDTAVELFLLDKDFLIKHKDWAKNTVRNWAKNRFVFPSFYGSVYFQTAPHLWEAITKEDPEVPGTGRKLTEHLRSKGIIELGDCEAGARTQKGSYVHHVKGVEDSFWNERFKVYTECKKRWWLEYLDTGYVDYYTGFRVSGLFRRNQVLNVHIQGCLAGDSKVLTREGHIPIKELAGKETEVWTGFRWAKAVGLDRGKCRRARIRLNSGLTVECDTRHKLKNEKDEWVEFKDMRVGDLVALPRTQEEPVEYSGEVNWPFVFGFILGDGCLIHRKHSESQGLTSGKYVTITGGRKKKPILDNIAAFLRSKDYKRVKEKVIPAAGSKDEKYSVRLEDMQFARFLEDKGFSFDWRSRTKRVPAAVWRMSLQDRRDFVEGLWMSDGARMRNQEGNLHTPNLDLLREVQVLIAPMGYDSQISETANGHLLRVRHRRFRSHTARLYPVAPLRRFVDRVRRRNYESDSPYVYDHRSFGSRKPISQYTAERIIEKNGEGGEAIYRYDSITAVELLDGEETTYTMSVDDPLHQFVADGVIHKNTSFHCLLWSLIQIQNELNRRKMRTLLVGQIHDSLIADCPEDEVQDYLTLSRRVMTQDLRRHWDWITVSLETEAEVCPRGAPWLEKKVWAEKAGLWQELKK